MKRMLTCITLLLLLIIPFTSHADMAQNRVVRVGAFNYFPGIFKDKDGVVKGFYVEALSDLGRRENIRFEYVYGSWSEGLERLKSGEVDLLTSVAYTPERAAYMDYATQPLLTVWGELYVPLKSKIDGIRGVQGKKIAVMKGDFNARYFMDLIKKFDITCEFIELPAFDDVFKAVASHKVDAGVVNNTFGVAKQHEYDLRSSGIVFNPFDIFFTVAKGENTELLKILNSYLANWRHEKNSVFNNARQKWSHGTTGTSQVIPQWLVSSVALLLLMVCAGLIFILLLRRQVRRATEAVLQREASLRESTELVNLLFDSTAEAIYGLDVNGNCTFCNSACLRMLGYDKPEQLIGRNMHDLIHHTHDDGTPFEKCDCLVFLAFQQGEGTHVDDEVLWKADGTSFPAEYWSYPIFRKGEIAGSVVTFFDITERRRNETELKNKNAELERFTYTVSHDLKSPLITIKGFAGSIQRDLKTGRYDRLASDLERIGSSADKMGALLKDLLELSRIGHIINSPELIDMAQLAHDVLENLSGLLRERSVQVSVLPGLEPLSCDGQRMAEVLQNLVENAVKYMGDQPEPQISIGMRHDGREKVYYVSDNGCGIDIRYHENIFGLFNKLNAESEGTGVGLALVKRIIEVHGGRVWVESPGELEGSTFCFTLPASSDHKKQNQLLITEEQA